MSVRAADTVGAVSGPLIGIMRRAARIVVSFWPALLAWFLFGLLGRYLVIQGAGWVGATHFGLGIALMPFAILCRLIAFVAMLLTVRTALPSLISNAPEPSHARQRRRQFVDALLAGILPFFAFYLAWGFLRDDMGSFYVRIDDVQGSRPLEVNAAGETIVPDAVGLALTWLTGSVIVITFVLRRLIKRYSSKSARVLPVIAVYLEALWVMLFALVLSQWLDSIGSWFNRRQGIVWLGEFRRSIAINVAPVDWLLTVGGWLVGELGGLILLPLAWLTIAGVIYDQTLSPASPTSRFLNRGRLARVRERARKVPSWLIRRLTDLWNNFISGLRPIGDAFKLMWHAGPLLIAVYVLLFRVVEWIAGQLDVVITRVIGPHPTVFWTTYVPAIAIIAPTLTAPLTIGVIAAAFDRVLARIRPAGESADESVDESGGEPAAESVGPDGVTPLSVGDLPPPTAAP